MTLFLGENRLWPSYGVWLVVGGGAVSSYYWCD